jgi:hypothetical protein
MPTWVNLKLRHIQVDNAGESAAEWRLTIAASAARGIGSYQTNFNQDDVNGGGNVYTINAGDWWFLLPAGGPVNFNTFGVELDGGLFDPDDSLPGISVPIDPNTAGSGFSVGADSGEFKYNIVMDVTALPFG